MKALTCFILALSIPSVHAIKIIKPIQKPVVAKVKTTEIQKPTVQNTRTLTKPVDKKTKPIDNKGMDNLPPTSKPIESWQWAIYEKHKVPVPYRFILEAIRMNECNQAGGYCYRSDVKDLATACMNPKRATGDGGVFQMNYIHGKIFDQTMIDLCNMRKAIKEKNDKDFVFWRDKLFEDQMLWTLNRLRYILEDDKLSWEDKVYKSAWRHHSNPSKSKNIRYANKALRNWRKITK